MEPLDLISVIVRAAAFVAALQAAGLAWFIAACRRAAVPAAPALDRLARRAACAAIVLVLIQRALDAGRLAGDWSGLGDTHLQLLVWSRRPGLSALVCAAGLLVVAITAGRRGRWRDYAASAGAVGIVASFALTGHSTDAVHAPALQAVVAVHVGLAAYWLGAVAGLHLLVRCADARAVARAASRFSSSAIWLVPLIFPVGVLLVWGLLPDLAALRTAYGACLLVKAMGFGGLLLLAAGNRHRNVPALSAGVPGAAQTFRRFLLAEYAVIAAVLTATATMTSLFSWH